ncbi:hypothetical protein BG005_007421, partial [Podila minutissima]
KGSKEIDEIHLANHPGYDIRRPTDFFKKYGSHVVAIMTAFQVGATVASVVVPQLVNSTLALDLIKVEAGLKFL